MMLSGSRAAAECTADCIGSRNKEYGCGARGLTGKMYNSTTRHVDILISAEKARGRMPRSQSTVESPEAHPQSQTRPRVNLHRTKEHAPSPVRTRCGGAHGYTRPPRCRAVCGRWSGPRVLHKQHASQATLMMKNESAHHSGGNGRFVRSTNEYCQSKRQQG